MAQDAELKLKVSLDLAYFRAQLSRLPIEAAGYSAPINLKINNKSIVDEMRRIDKFFAKRNYNLQINDTALKTARTNAQKLKNTLDLLTRTPYEIKIGTQQRGATIEQIQNIFARGKTGEAFGGGAVGQARANVSREALLKRLEKKSISEGGYNLPGLRRIIEELGGIPVKGHLRAPLVAQAQKLAKEVDDAVIERVYASVKDLKMQLKPIRGQAQTSAARSMPNLNQMLDRIANLTENPRAAQRMLRMMPESRLTTDLIGAANRQATFREQFPQGYRLPGFNAPKAFDPLLKAIAKDFTDYAKTINITNPWVGQIGDGIRRIVAVSAQSATTTVKALPPIGGTTSPLNILEQRLAQSRGMFGTGGGVLSSLFSGGAVVPQGMLASAAGRPRFARFQPNVSTPAGIFNTPGIAVQQTIPGMAYQMAKPSVGSMGMFPMAGMMGPSTPLTINARTSMFGGGSGRGGKPPMGGGSMGFGSVPEPINFSIFQKARLPLSGAIQELSSEFANATKQVLLFGTAYKGLAFFINLPNQAFEAAKSLATYKNQLQAVTSETNTFEQSFAFVDNLAMRFNVPLESARQGFVKLYASMQPAGFSQAQIEGLFTGISKAAAAFGLSADKVDRVNYAFAQMASKGQIMSEELKGQLGDVLPGALGLFAQAAQMSIPEFSKAMEDGAFKGKAMQQVLDNVAILMNNKFGPAAQGAAKTLQGAVNQMQNNLQLMYESMSPIVNQFAAAFSGPVNALIQDVAKSVQLLTANVVGSSDAVSTLSPRAQEMYSIFQQLGPSVMNAASNLGNFFSSLQVLIGPLVAVTKGLLDFLAIPFVARVGLYATIITALNGAFQLLARTGLVQATIAMVQFAVSLNIAQINVYVAGIQTVIAVLRSLITTANIAKLAIMGIKVALVSFGVGVALLAFDAIAQRILNIGNAAESAKKSTRELAQELDGIASSGNIEAATKQYLDANTKLVLAQRKNQKALAELSDLQQRAGKQSGDEPWAVKEARMRADQTYSEVLQARRDLQAARQTRASAVRIAEQQRTQVQSSLQKVDLSAGEAGKTKGKKTPIEEILDRESQRRAKLRASDVEKRLSERIRDAKLSGNEAEAESLEMLPRALELRGKIAALEEFRNMLIEKENQIVGDSLTQKQFDNKLQDANVTLYELRNDLTKEYYNLQVKENEKAKEINKNLEEQKKKQEDLRRILQDAEILTGKIGFREVERIRQQRQFEDEVNRARELGASPEQIVGLMATQAQIPRAGSLAEQMQKLRQELEKMASIEEVVKNSAEGIGNAFGNSFKEIINGSMTAQQALASFFQSVGDYFLDMASRMIAKWIEMKIIGLVQSLLPGGMGGFFSGNAGISGIAAQYTGGEFTGGSFGVDTSGMTGPTTSLAPLYGTKFANGGIAYGGFRAFANGGMVTGPTMGLVGEGRYNEAIVPLPDGKSIPVELGGATGGTNIVVNVDAKGTKVAGNEGASQTLARDLAAVVDQRLVYHKRAGGLLSR